MRDVKLLNVSGFIDIKAWSLRSILVDSNGLQPHASARIAWVKFTPSDFVL